MTEADLFFCHGPWAVKLQQPPTSYLHPSADSCKWSFPLVAFVLPGAQEKLLNISSKVFSLFFNLKTKKMHLIWPLCCLGAILLLDGSVQDCRFYLSSEIMGCCFLPLPPLLHYWSLASFLLVCPSTHSHYNKEGKLIIEYYHLLGERQNYIVTTVLFLFCFLTLKCIKV